MSNQSLNLHIRNRMGTVLNLEVVSITSFNAKGSFDILPSHANFISLIEKSILYETSEGKKGEYPLEKGLLRNSNNLVEVFLGINE